MYFPYLRNRENEVLAILELAPKLVESSLVVPLFNVVKNDKVFSRRISRIAATGQKVCVVANTAPVDQQSDVYGLLEKWGGDYGGHVLPGFEIDADTSEAALRGFAKRFPRRQAVIIHRKRCRIPDIRLPLKGLLQPAAHVYFSGVLPVEGAYAVPAIGNIVMHDGFARAIKNGLYPRRSPFPSHVEDYSDLGFQGFGDFGIVGDHYKVGGGKASNVALHLTERAGEKLVCNHFVSEDAHIDSHIHVQYEDARDKLLAYVGSPQKKLFRTDGVVDGYVANSDFHGLGWPKRWSLKHHIEMLNLRLVSKGVVPFI